MNSGNPYVFRSDRVFGNHTYAKLRYVLPIFTIGEESQRQQLRKPKSMMQAFSGRHANSAITRYLISDTRRRFRPFFRPREDAHNSAGCTASKAHQSGPKNRRASWLQAEKFKKKCLNELSRNPPAKLSRLCHTLSPLARCQNPHSRGPSHSSLVAP